MNINPLGISAYSKGDVSRKTLDPAQRAQEQFAVETQKQDNSLVRKSESSRTENANSVTMARRDAETSSSLSVKANSEFTQLLSPEELEAIDILFAKYAENQSTDASYSARGQKAHAPRLGAKVDFRV